jgi:hypothetical protein
MKIYKYLNTLSANIGDMVSYHEWYSYRMNYLPVIFTLYIIINVLIFYLLK